MHELHCVCSYAPEFHLKTRIVVVMHCRELEKTTSTAQLALLSLPNHELHIHGTRDERLDLTRLHEEGRRVLLLYPGLGARPLDEVLQESNSAPISLIVPDGNWRQAQRAARRIPGLAEAERVYLPDEAPTRWGIRHEPKPGGLATYEAIARALGKIEGGEVQAEMEAFFDRAVAITKEARGDVPAPLGDSETLPILYQDSDLVIINKPSGLLVHRNTDSDGRPALQILRDQMGEWVYPVHRIDRGTSGILVFARTPEIARHMSEQFEAGTVKKVYLALCRGADPELTRVDAPIPRDLGGPPRPATTEFRFLGAFEGRYGLYEVHPHSGRRHQIRIHLKHASHPIIGDVRYGKGEHNRAFRERFGFHRLALHALALTFQQPTTGATITIRAPLPEEFESLLGAIRLPLKPENRCDDPPPDQGAGESSDSLSP